jgi:hypothetical protein
VCRDGLREDHVLDEGIGRELGALQAKNNEVSPPRPKELGEVDRARTAAALVI